MKATIALLDLDGVLILPYGYRASVNASMQYLVEKMGIHIETPVEEIAPLFEALGITCEWDMLALLTAILFDAVAEQGRGKLPSMGLAEALEWCEAHAPRQLQVDFKAKVQALSPHLVYAPIPAESVYLARQKGAGLFPHLDHQLFLNELLCETRELEKTLTSVLFQNLVLGDRVFAETYSAAPIISTPSFLEKYDLPALESETSQRLMALWRAGRLHLSVFTARPSLPPRDVEAVSGGYSPEAEMAVDLVGLSGIPIMGYGRLQWLAGQTGESADAFLKPAPVQALAALRAALTREEAQSLLWARKVQSDSRGNLCSDLPQEIDLHVFEDSAIGITAARHAANLLNGAGIKAELHCWGIAKHPDKVAALRRVGADIFADVNAAMDQAFGTLS